MKIIKNPSSDEINEIIHELSEDNLVVYPTDTLYGIASNITSYNAIQKVFDAKKRDYDKALSVCLHDFKQLKQVAYLNKKQEKIAKMLFPGTYTLLLKKQEEVSDFLTSNSDIIGVRIPDNKISHQLTREFPITTTSANISNENTSNNIQDIIKQLGDNISVYIDDGILKMNKSSTIIDLTQEKAKVLRYGLYDEDKLKHILKMNLY